MKQGKIHFHFPREKVHYYFNSYTTYEKPKKNRNRRRRSQRLRQQAIKEEGADQKKEVVEGEAALEAKEEDKFLDKEPQKQKTKKVWRKKEITPPSTLTQEMKILSSKPEEEKSLEDHWKEANIVGLRQMDQEPKVPSLYRQKALPNMRTEEEKSGEDSVPSDTPSSAGSSQKVRFDGPKSPNLRRKVSSVVILIFTFLHSFTLAYLFFRI
jgi:hypothetical protein